MLRRALTAALRRRFGTDYRVRSAASSGAALGALRRLHHEAADVAMIIADFWLPGTGGVAFLAQAREYYPGAQCVLLTTFGDEAAAESLHRALALGEIDRFVQKPWRSPEE